MMIVMKTDDTVLLRPFRWNEKVRLSCDMIVDFIRKMGIEVRLLDGQKDICIIIMSIRLIHRNIGEGIMELNDAGSNEEKMSLIIQNMGKAI